jgi:ribosome silencing factor RsfS/YbeB/iojap
MTPKKTVRKASKAPAKSSARPARPAASKAAKSKQAPPKPTAPRKTARAPKKAVAAAVPSSRPALAGVVQTALDDLKAQNVTVLDVRDLTDVTDTIVVASGTSDRHVKSLARSVVDAARKAGYKTAGVEGEREGEWVLVDLHDVVVHVMLPKIREFYGLEKLWDMRAGDRPALG